MASPKRLPPGRWYKVPKWFQTEAVHKAIFFGPDRLKVPACKIFRRECWPNDGCYEPADVSKRNWKDVTCTVCRDEIPWLSGAGPKRAARTRSDSAKGNK